MPRAALIIQNFSYDYVRNVAEYIHKQLKKHIDPDALFLPCDQIDEAEYPDGTFVFLIGEQFRSFKRRPECRYIYFNFSVVAVLGNPFGASFAGLKAIGRKRRLLNAKLPLIDMVLDFYPPQTNVLQRKLPCPVLGFDVAISPLESPVPMSERVYDVCFVGGQSTRRRAVCDAILAQGMMLSPASGVIIEEIAAQSRCCLNVHAVRSHHYEAPRIIAALSTGTPIVSEHTFGLGELADQEFVVQEGTSKLSLAIMALLSNPDRSEKLGIAAYEWYTSHYLPNAEQKWQNTCQEILRIC